jgi:hypothetical protein
VPAKFGEWLLTTVVDGRTWMVLFGYEKDGVLGFLVFPDGEDSPPEVNVWWSTLLRRFDPISRSDTPDAVYDSLRSWIDGSLGRIRLGS